MRLDIGKYRIQRLLDAIPHGERMQPVQAQQAFDELVLAETFEENLRAVAELFVRDGKNAFERVAVQIDDRSNEPLVLLARRHPSRTEPAANERFRSIYRCRGTC